MGIQKTQAESPVHELSFAVLGQPVLAPLEHEVLAHVRKATQGEKTFMASKVKLKIVNPWISASGIQISGCSNRINAQVASARMLN